VRTKTAAMTVAVAVPIVIKEIKIDLILWQAPMN
jgi:hypothetical protein